MPPLLSGRSYLLLGELDETALPPILPIDRLSVSADGLAVKELRPTLTQAQQRPYGENRLLLITQAEDLSDIHQNTLLKLLEEPPSFLVIVLQARSAEGFLSTVRSRVTVVRSGAAAQAAEPVFSQTLAATQATLQAAKDRPALSALLRQELHFQLGQLDQPVTPARLGLLERSLNRLERNANQKLTIDWLLLRWYAQTGKEKEPDV